MQMLPAGPWSQQRQWASGAGQDALIAGDKEVGLGKQGASQHPFIVRIDQPEPQALLGPWCDGLTAQEGFNRLDLGGRQLALAAEHGAQHQPQWVSAEASGQKGTPQHVGVEANPHVANPYAAQQLGAVQEMAENKLSSLSQPAASPQGRAWRRNRS